MRNAFFFISLTMLSCAGCASNRGYHCVSVQKDELNRSLIFNVVGATGTGTSVPARVQWPVANSGTLVRERIHFTEVSEDRQGRNRSGDTDYRRRFRTFRRGLIER